MKRYTKTQIKRKPPASTDVPFTVRRLSVRYRLSIDHAAVVAGLAGIGVRS